MKYPTIKAQRAAKAHRRLFLAQQELLEGDPAKRAEALQELSAAADDHQSLNDDAPDTYYCAPCQKEHKCGGHHLIMANAIIMNIGPNHTRYDRSHDLNIPFCDAWFKKLKIEELIKKDMEENP